MMMASKYDTHNNLSYSTRSNSDVQWTNVLLICFFCFAQCIALVDYYTPIFLSEVTSLKPREFCHKINICQLIQHSALQVQEDTCGFCKETVSTLLDKLKDRDTKVSNFIFMLWSLILLCEILLHLSWYEQTFSLVSSFTRLSSTTKLWWVLHIELLQQF